MDSGDKEANRMSLDRAIPRVQIAIAAGAQKKITRKKQKNVQNSSRLLLLLSLDNNTNRCESIPIKKTDLF